MRLRFLIAGMIPILTAVSFSTISLADSQNNLSVKGQFRFRIEADDKTDFLGDRDFGLIRVRPEITFTRDAALSVVFTPQFARTMGEPIYSPAVNTGTNTKQATSGGTFDPSFTVHEAYGYYHPADCFGLKAGRMVLAYGDELILGALDWNNVGRSFDAVKTRFNYGIGWSDLFVSKIVDNNTVASGTGGDISFYGFYNSFDFGTYLKAFDIYGLYQQDASTAAKTQLGAVGARAASKFNQLDYRTEYTKELGSAFTDATTASQFRFEGGYTFDITTKPRLAAEYFTAGKNYNQLYPTSHAWLGQADVLGRRNLNGFAIKTSAQLSDGFTGKAEFRSFTRADSNASAYKYGGTTALGTATGSSSNSIGSEWDLGLSYQAIQDLTFSGGASLFNSGAYLTDQFGQVNPVFYYAQMEVKL